MLEIEIFLRYLEAKFAIFLNLFCKATLVGFIIVKLLFNLQCNGYTFLAFFSLFSYFFNIALTFMIIIKGSSFHANVVTCFNIKTNRLYIPYTSLGISF